MESVIKDPPVQGSKTIINVEVTKERNIEEKLEYNETGD